MSGLQALLGDQARRADNILGWAKHYKKLLPISAFGIERVRFDMQAMQCPGISGVEYQQGELHGYEVREYLLEKWGRSCAYCGAENTPLPVEHIQPRARGGTNRISNLTLSCGPCNHLKAARHLEEFLGGQPALLRKILAKAKAPLNRAAAVNATRNAVFFGLRSTGLPVNSGSGGRTKYNRARQGIPKAHCLDAACVEDTPVLTGWDQPVLVISADGRGTYCRTRVTASGFPRGYLMRRKSVRGFQTGDMVRAVVPTGKKAGTYTGRVAVRATGSFDIKTETQTVQGINAKHCTLLSRSDGYSYAQEKRNYHSNR